MKHLFFALLIFLVFLTINGCTPVTIDVKPGSDPNSINLAKLKGTVPIAFISSATFDATLLDPDLIVIIMHDTPDPNNALWAWVHGDPISRNKHGRKRFSYEDVNGDGLLDFVFHITIADFFNTWPLPVAYITAAEDTGEECDYYGTDMVNVVDYVPLD